MQNAKMITRLKFIFSAERDKCNFWVLKFFEASQMLRVRMLTLTLTKKLQHKPLTIWKLLPNCVCNLSNFFL